MHSHELMLTRVQIGVTGGEEDGVNNEKADRKKLYSNPRDIWAVHEALSEVTPNFSIAAGECYPKFAT